MSKDKKKPLETVSELIGQLEPSSNYIEILTASLLILGFLAAVIIKNPTTIYTVIFLIGLLTGRTVYKKENSLKSYMILLAGLFAGYILGSRVGNLIVTTLFFIAGNYVSYILHKKGIIE